jgi:hypothetical protein
MVGLYWSDSVAGVVGCRVDVRAGLFASFESDFSNVWREGVSMFILAGLFCMFLMFLLFVIVVAALVKWIVK